MNNEVKILTVFDPAAGIAVHVDDVATGLACNLNCPDCGRTLIAKNAGKERAHHFSHSESKGACEGILHATCKWLLYQRLENCLREGVIP